MIFYTKIRSTRVSPGVFRGCVYGYRYPKLGYYLESWDAAGRKTYDNLIYACPETDEGVGEAETRALEWCLANGVQPAPSELPSLRQIS